MTEKQLDKLIELVNAAGDAEQNYSDATIAAESPDPVAETLYEATYELVGYLRNMLTRGMITAG